MADRWRPLALFVLRVVPSLLLAFLHGWSKLVGFSEKVGRFPDPLHVGRTASLVLTIFGELVCRIAVALGLATRLAAIPPLVTMLVVAFVVHHGDPLGDSRELALAYAVPFFAIAILGAGPWSLDGMWRKRRS